MMGAFPPPVGGAAKVNGIVHDALVEAGVEVVRIDLAARQLAHSRSLRYHLDRIARNGRGLLTARRRGRGDATLYIAPDGGAGAWYSWAHVRGVGGGYGRIVIHHHTCRYIAERSRPVAMFTAAHRARATHVFLSPGMAAAFGRQYGPVDFLVASNARFVVDEARAEAGPRAPGPLRLGHLSNLCRDKGFFDVADTFDAVRAAGIAAQLHLAGPVLEPEVTSRIAALRATHGDAVSHAGPVAGDDKLAWYRGIDLFLFPTRWRQEAAPIVTYEAAAAGVPVLATSRGVIAEIVPAERGAVCPAGADFVAFAREQIARFDRGDAVARAAAVKASIRTDCDRSVAQWSALIGLLGGGGAEARIARS